MIGSVDYEMTDKKIKSREFSRSLFVSKDVKPGDIIDSNNIKSVRPGHGLHTKHYNEILGKTFVQTVTKGTPLTMEMIEKN